ncbi:hypothetical protein ALC56_07079 [Trachymyrmex septentrionalis]|uniref:Uncharacterized protein n=1 Tax=Trachymyrmex septentrionalis TaxID=34720 RepID=A0A195FDY7_9HYME|nr:hypothetical protein ALC56_07079 [Trachymyrmex septentrionalis]
MDEEGRKVIEGHLIVVDRTLIGLTRFSPCNAKLDVCCCDIFEMRARVFANESAYRTIVFLIRTHLVPPFIFHPNRVNGAKGCNVEEGESSCEFYANLIADTKERLETAENPGIVIARYTVTMETFLVTHRNQRRSRQHDRIRAIPDNEISNRYYRDRSEEIKREWGKSFNHVATTDRN